MPDADPTRWTRPQDVAAIAVRLCGGDGHGVTGAAIPEGAKRLILRENLRGLLLPILKAKGYDG